MLVRQVQSGDMAAFGRLTVKYQDRVVNLCYRVSGSPDDAQDLAQEAFLNALEKIGAYRFQASFYTWLCRIAINESLSWRRKSRRVTLSLHAEDGQWAAGTAPGRAGVSRGEDDPLASVSAREIQQLVAKGIEALDDDHRTVLVLRDIDGLDYREIADVLEVNVGTVKSRLHRARMSLRELLVKRKAGIAHEQ